MQMWSCEVIMEIDHSVVMYGTNKNQRLSDYQSKFRNSFFFFSSWCEALQSCFDSRCRVQSPYSVNKLSVTHSTLYSENHPSIEPAEMEHVFFSFKHEIPIYGFILMNATRLCTKWQYTVNGIIAGSNAMAALCWIMAVWLQLSNPTLKTSLATLTCSLYFHSSYNRSFNVSNAESITGLIIDMLHSSMCHILLSERNVFVQPPQTTISQLFNKIPSDNSPLWDGNNKTHCLAVVKGDIHLFGGLDSSE